jgi:hypothetical protein
VVVISPPGGIGELTSVESAKSGSAVQWIVVSSSSDNVLSLNAHSLQEIQTNGGSIDCARANAQSLLYEDAASAVSKWCVGAKAVVCTYDGDAEEGRRSRNTAEEAVDSEGVVKMIRRGVRVAAREAALAAGGDAKKVVALFSGEEMTTDEKDGDNGSKGFLNLFGSNGGKNVPETLKEAMGEVSVVRYGELFGAAESSVSLCV